jgi:ATP-dependent DNA helicase RecG
MFDDHITVESPGTLPGTVRLNNMREIHFSRNPKMAQLLHEYEYVREFGEGVDRMYREMEEAGLPEPEYKTVAFMVHATIKNKKYLVGDATAVNAGNTMLKNAEDELLDERTKKIIDFCKIPRSREEIMSYVGLANREHFRKKILKPLLERGKLEMTDKEHPKSKNQKYVSKK